MKLKTIPQELRDTLKQLHHRNCGGRIQLHTSNNGKHSYFRCGACAMTGIHPDDMVKEEPLERKKITKLIRESEINRTNAVNIIPVSGAILPRGRGRIKNKLR